MTMKANVKKIDLHLPTGWGTATTEELEIIAAAIISEQATVGRYRVFDWQRVKLNVVLAINGISVVGRDDDENHALQTDGEITENGVWLVQRPEDKEPWEISAGQIVALTERLNWIDDNNIKSPIFHFPYQTLVIDHLPLNIDRSPSTIDHSSFLRPDGSKCPKAERTIQGPPPLMDGYTWKEYRWMTDWMQAYMRHSNALLQVKSEELRVKNQEAMENARNEFLAVLFKPKTGGSRDSDKIDAAIFTDFSPVQWQVILFWWSSLMHILQGKFPRVFKKQTVGKGKKKQRRQAGTEWDFYNSVTASIQKYIGGLSAQDVDNQPYGVTLQQLEMMAKESEEMERLKRK